MTRGLWPGVSFARDNLKTDISMLVRTLTAAKLCEPSSYCSIKKLEVNQKISQMRFDHKDSLDKSVSHILRKDIQVRELPLMLDRKMTLQTLYRKGKNNNIPDIVKIARWTPDEDRVIQNNIDNLVSETRSKKDREGFLENLFSPSKKKLHKEKINIVGNYLGQGLKDPRLPCEIFGRASRLIMIMVSEDSGHKIIFTEEDDKIILDYMKNNSKTDKTPFVSLSKLLGYPASTIHMRNKRVLQQRDKTKKGAYSEEESMEIMNSIFQDNKDALNHSYLTSDPVWDKIGRKLNRNPFGILHHWEAVIRAILLSYENGKENVDFRPILIDYFIEKGIMFRNETNWSEVMEDERFKGTTPLFLQRQYCNMVGQVKRKDPNIGNSEITSQVLKSCFDGMHKHKTKIQTGGFSRLIQHYVAIKEKW